VRLSHRARVALAAVPTVFFTVLFAWPVAQIVATGLRPAGEWELGEALDTLRRHADTIAFTGFQAALSTAVTLAVALPGAWALARFRFPGRTAVRVLVTLPFVLPTVVVATAFRGLVGRGGLLAGWVELDDSLAAIIAAHVFFNYAVVIWTVGERWSHLDRRVEEAARVLGDSRWAVLRRVTIPLLWPSVLAAAVLIFLFTATSFGIVVLLGGPEHATVEVAIARSVGALLDLPAAAALSLLQVVAVGTLLAVHARLRERSGGPVRQVAEDRGARRPVGRSERLAVIAVVGPTVVLIGAPLLVLVERSLRVGDGYGLEWYRRLGDAGRDSVLFVSPLEAIRTSLGYAAVAAAISVVIGLCGALVVAEGRDRLSRVTDVVLAVPLGVSAVTVGLGFLVALDQPPLDLRGEPVLVPLAHALIGVPFVVRLLVPALRAIDPQLREAAGVLGAGPWRRVRDIDLALTGRALLLAAGFSFAISLGEFGATTVLARADTPTISVAIGRFLGRPGAASFGQAAAMSVILLGVTAVVAVASQRGRVSDLGRF
jgi:thiamine transport system permease protein